MVKGSPVSLMSLADGLLLRSVKLLGHLLGDHADLGVFLLVLLSKNLPVTTTRLRTTL